MPDQYAGLENPYRGDGAVSARGRGMFVALCADCHGIDAAGHGPLAASLDPPPPDLLEVVDEPSVTDGYLFWRIAEGGAATGTGMPAWAPRLDDDEIWSVITHLQCEVTDCRDWNPRPEVGR